MPGGPNKGQKATLTPAACTQLLKIYDMDEASSEPISGTLGAYLALPHICGPEALQYKLKPDVAVDSWAVWRATSQGLQKVLKRDGERVVCPGLGTCYPDFLEAA